MDFNNNPPVMNHQKPWLLPSCHKLRHLQGIIVRNLAVSTPNNSRAPGKTIDDNDVPNSLQSPEKILAQNAASSVQHSRSFTDLKFAQSPGQRKYAVENQRADKADTKRMRRRSTLPWAGANPAIRQSKLEDITANNMADTWFSIHCPGIEYPVYISEVVDKAMNPNFQFFDLNSCGPTVSRLDQLTVKLWAKTATMPEFVPLVELELNLRSLQYIGKTLENFHHPLPPNCILFIFPDGVYTNLTDLPPVEATGVAKSSRLSTPIDNAQPSCSYDALMRLANLDDCIQDALITRDKLESQINTILDKNREDIDVVNRTSQAEEKLASTKRAIAAERKQLRQSVKRKEELKRSLEARRASMRNGRQTQDKSRDHLSGALSTMTLNGDVLDTNTKESTGQIRRICEDLLSIYPIEPIAGKPLAFTIGGLPLPNSSFEDIDKTSVAAALGYTAQLVYQLSFYLSTPLPYPIKPYLSNSFIQDPISIGLPQRTYPLYPINTHYRFEYGVFLLNKDIEFLLNRVGLRLLDLRHTLPNLKYLLYVLTSGNDELPARKAGGVRGLLNGGITPNLSRRGSAESFASGEIINPKRLSDSHMKANGGIHLDRADGRMDGPSSSFTASHPTNTLPHRTSGLRKVS
ncbi:hypothetical protein FQN54_006357 [Arachnomyces sp. PD_36]|nr:hypothetical protein FQN54_006357 [Arachnomyces sp. PD_36]